MILLLGQSFLPPAAVSPKSQENPVSLPLSQCVKILGLFSFLILVHTRRAVSDLNYIYTMIGHL